MRVRLENQHHQAVARVAAHPAPTIAKRPADRAVTRAVAPAAATAQRVSTPVIEFRLFGEFIALDNLLKLTGTAPSGGAAKAMAAEGAVKVDGVVELRKTCKIRVGQLVQTRDTRIRVLAA